MAGEGRFLTGSTMGHVVRMATTGALGITFVFLVDLANLFWISQLGEARLVAAIGFAFAIQFFSVQIGVGLMIGATALVSRHIGMGDRVAAREVAGGTMVIAFLLQALVAAAVVTFRVPLLESAGAEGETLRLAARYLALTMPSLAIMAVGLVGTATLRAEGDGFRAMFVTLTSGAVSMLVDPLVILGLGMGLDGAALGLVLSRVILTGMALRFAVGTHDLIARPAPWIVRSTAVPLMAIALPAMLTQMSAPFGNYLLTSVIAGFGDSAVAAWAVVNRLTVVAFGGLFALSGAIGGIFGQNYGAKLFHRLRSAYRDALVFCAVYALIAWGLIWVSAGVVMRGFAIDGVGGEVYRAFASIGAGAFVFAGAVFVATAAFNNLGRPGRSALINWGRDGVLMLPAAWWLSGFFAAPGVIYAQALVAVVIGGIAAIWAYQFVSRLDRITPGVLDLGTRRGYRDANRARRR